ncbi:Mak11p [Sugiyamaella lignohabitans]|uniref:Mak11p n=1 Tax=Sugiyamaella lignohabitans TaxID=796027 RepID=A0A167F651_9ASCO|nr:Mak11p [Sugiyamaella lignohabitans]ANB14884.1 Mak11p [Sugiyamaella lignohabitans]
MVTPKKSILKKTKHSKTSQTQEASPKVKEVKEVTVKTLVSNETDADENPAEVSLNSTTTSITTTTKGTIAPTFRIVTGSYEHNLLCVSLSLFKDLEVFNPIFHFTAHTQSIRCLAQSKRYLVSGSNDEHIRIYDLQKRKELGTLLHHSGSVTVLEFFESKWLFSAAGDGNICIWRCKDWEVLGELKGHKGAVNDISIHPSGKIGLSVGEDKTLRLWNLMTARKASIVKLGGVGLKVRWTSEGDQYIIGYDRKIEIYTSSAEKLAEKSLTSGLQHMDIFKSKEGEEYLVTSHNNGKIIFTLISSLISESSDKDEKNTFELVGHGVRVKHFSFYYNQQNETPYMASVSSDGKLVIWDLSVRDQVAVYSTADRLNCCIIVPEDIEKADSMKKRLRADENGDAISDTDFSEVESDGEEVVKLSKKQKKKNKNKKAKVSVEFEKTD